MSKIYVDEIAGIASADTVAIPGHVIQVVQGTTSTGASITGSSYAESNLSASITPSSTSSKILVSVNQAVYMYTTSSASQIIAGIRLLRDSTAILEPYTDGTGPLEPYLEITGGTAVYNSFRHTMQYLDSPNTTSSITYKTQGRLRNTGNGATLQFQPQNNIDGTSTITLMEIAG